MTAMLNVASSGCAGGALAMLLRYTGAIIPDRLLGILSVYLNESVRMNSFKQSHERIFANILLNSRNLVRQSFHDLREQDLQTMLLSNCWGSAWSANQDCSWHIAHQKQANFALVGE